MSESFPHPLTVVRRSAAKQIAAATRAGSTVLDVTSKGPQPWIQFSPFFPHRNIPIPRSDGYTTASVEGAWQGLKVFESEDIDRSRFRVVDMKGLKRSSRKYGRVLGHRAGVSSPASSGQSWSSPRVVLADVPLGALSIRCPRSSRRFARC